MRKDDSGVNYNAIDPSQVPMKSGYSMLGEQESIVEILKNEGFLERIKHKLLGEKLNKDTRQYEPLSLREVKTNGTYQQEALIITCVQCGMTINQHMIMRCNICGEPLNNLKCEEHGIIKQPVINCGLCHSGNITFNKVIKHYVNDAAQMNQQGANEIIGLLSMTDNPLYNMGSSIEFYKLRQQRALLTEIGLLIDRNYKRYDIREENIEAVKASINHAINSILSLILTDKPKSLLERLTNIFHEFKQTSEFNSPQKNKGWAP